MRKIVERPPVAVLRHTVLPCQRPHAGAFGMEVAEGERLMADLLPLEINWL